VGWKKYQPQSDRARHKHWFRINMDCAFSHGLFGLTPEQRWFWVQVLCECCRKDSDTVIIWTERFSKLCDISEKSIISAIKILEDNNTVRVLSGDCQKSVSLLRPHNITKHNEHNITEQYITNCTVAPESGTPVPISEKTLLDKTSELVRKKILETYPDPEFISQELKQMEIWVATNPEKSRRTQKGWGQFLNNWFKKSWDKYQKSLISHPVSKWPKVYHEELWKPVEKLDDR
jgi:hypothetical protein